MAILTAADYPAIRAAIDTSLTPEDLPDGVIGLDIYAGDAQREVRRRVPGAEELAGDEAAEARAAAVLLCAALLVPAVPQIVGESHGDDTYSRKLADPATLAAELRARALDKLAALVTPDQAPERHRPTLFRTAGGRRGR